MTDHALLLAGNRVLTIANPADAALGYHARLTRVPPGHSLETRRSTTADTLIVLVEGHLDVMVNGAVMAALPGGHLLIARGLWYGLRATGRHSALILTRMVPGPCAPPAGSCLWRVSAA
jgi:hypothetical protein